MQKHPIRYPYGHIVSIHKTESPSFRILRFLPDIICMNQRFILYSLFIVTAILVGYSQYRKRKQGK